MLSKHRLWEQFDLVVGVLDGCVRELTVSAMPGGREQELHWISTEYCTLTLTPYEQREPLPQ